MMMIYHYLLSCAITTSRIYKSSGLIATGSGKLDNCELNFVFRVLSGNISIDLQVINP
jgi:hypothetical protein